MTFHPLEKKTTTDAYRPPGTRQSMPFNGPRHEINWRCITVITVLEGVTGHETSYAAPDPTYSRPTLSYTSTDTGRSAG